MPSLAATSFDTDRAAALVETIHQRLVSLCLRERTLTVPPVLPPLLDILQQPLPDTGLYDNALRDLQAQTGQKFPSPAVFLEFHFNLLLLQGVSVGVDAALAAFVQRLMAAPFALWKTAAIENLGAFFIQNHWLDGPLKKTRGAVRKAAMAKANPETARKLLTLTRVIGFSVAARREWLDFLFQSLILPAIGQAAKAHMYDVVLRLEWTAYMNYTKVQDDAVHFAATVGKWAPLMRRAGKAFGAKLPRLVAPKRRAGPPKVAFYLHNSEILGHTEALLSFLRGLRKLDAKPIEAVLYISGEPNPELDEQMQAYGVTHVYLKRLMDGPGQTTQELTAMREDCRRREVVAVVYVSLVLTMPFAFSMRLAPVQIWWSMKYHSLEMPEIDGYMALGSFDRYREIDGRQWRAVHRAMTTLFDPALSGEAGEIRTRLLGERGTLLLGCIGRDEKLVSEDYIAALSRVLNAMPGAVFVWTGKWENAQVLALMRKYDISARCHFVGWINSRLYAQVLDIFLDSFPFASGLTAFEAMAAERPVVSMLTREALGTGMPAHVWPVYQGEVGTPETQQDVRSMFSGADGGSLLPFAQSVDEYVEIALRLSGDAGYRRQVGSALGSFVRRYMTNDVKMAESGCQHIVEIIDQTIGDD